MSTDCIACVWEHAVEAPGPPSCKPTHDLTSCGPAKLLEAEPSEFHDAPLAAATKKINKILSAIPANENGLTASLIHSRHGVLLARVKHGGRPSKSKKTVTAHSDDATVAKALRLKLQS